MNTLKQLIPFLQAARQCAMQMMQNAAYIQKEASTIVWPDSLLAVVQTVCTSLIETKFDAMTELDELEQLDPIHHDCAEFTQRIDHILNWLGEPLGALDELVQTLQTATMDETQDVPGYLLVAESAYNIINSHTAVLCAAEALKQKLTRPPPDCTSTPMLLDLTYEPYHGPSLPFRVEVLHLAIEQLIMDASNAYRIYELMMIRRPGDVWKYLWVKVVEVSAEVTKSIAGERGRYRICPWPEHELPLSVFDSFFYNCGDDTTPESSCWLRERRSPRFRDLATKLFAQVQQAQRELGLAEDLMIQSELKAIKDLQHFHDQDPYAPWERTQPDYETPTHPTQTDAYYKKLRELLALPAMRCVSGMGTNDYHTMRLLCTEQMRRARINGTPLGHDMPFTVLTDYYPSLARWGAKVSCVDAGPAYGDLIIDDRLTHQGLAGLFDYATYPAALTSRDAGEINEYQRTTGDGWTLYECTLPNFPFAEFSKQEQADFILRMKL